MIDNSKLAKSPPSQQPERSPAGQPRDEQLPPLGEQMAQQLGGWRGMIESGIPVLVFVITNAAVGRFIPDGSRTGLQWAIGASIAVALGIAGLRLVQRRPIRFAVNGLFGIALGAILAWRSGEARDFYVPGIWWNLGYGVLLLGSIALRHPLVGWFWSVIANGGKDDWRVDRRLVRLFNRLTVLWSATFLVKFAVQGALYLNHQENWLAVARIGMGTPVFALLVAVSFWAVRRARQQPALS